MLAGIDPNDWKLSTMLLVGDVLNAHEAIESRLYSADYSHKFRKAARSVSA